MIKRVAGTGDGGSWLDQVESGTFDLSDAAVSDSDLAALLAVVKERLRHVRAISGGTRDSAVHPYAGSGLRGLLEDRLPLNRKERFYTGTVLPMLIASDGFAHLDRFLMMCDLDVEVLPQGIWALEGEQPVEFFTEYSFADSVVGPHLQARFADRPREADTPDVVIAGPDWLLAVEAKMFHRPSSQALDAQMRRQQRLVDYWATRFDLDSRRVRHVLLAPEQLLDSRPGLSAPAITWQAVLERYEPVAPPYWIGVLRLALQGYDHGLASREPTFRKNMDRLISGDEIIENFRHGHLAGAWMGRTGGLGGKALKTDVEGQAWRTRPYEVKGAEVNNRNWFPVERFVNLVDPAGTLTSGDHPSPQRHALLSSADDLVVEATLTHDGGVVIQGQDLSGAIGYSEYEFALTVAPEDVPKLLTALGGTPDDDPIGLLEAAGEEIASAGGSTWLERHGVPAEFWSRFDS